MPCAQRLNVNNYILYYLTSTKNILVLACDKIYRVLTCFGGLHLLTLFSIFGKKIISCYDKMDESLWQFLRGDTAKRETK